MTTSQATAILRSTRRELRERGMSRSEAVRKRYQALKAMNLDGHKVPGMTHTWPERDPSKPSGA